MYKLLLNNSMVIGKFKFSINSIPLPPEPPEIYWTLAPPSSFNGMDYSSIHDWIKEKNISYQIEKDKDKEQFYIIFSNEEDAVFFKLNWL